MTNDLLTNDLLTPLNIIMSKRYLTDFSFECTYLLLQIINQAC